jgi:drug/metabolite transporter (DMT)-like permease
MLLPVLIFLGSGLIDSLLKYVQAIVIQPNQAASYSIIVFVVAFVLGIIISAFQTKRPIQLKLSTWLLGMALGAVNFGSLYFFIMALNHSALKSSVVFALNNMCIVALSAGIGMLLFGEKLNKYNFAGLVLAFLSLLILTA